MNPDRIFVPDVQPIPPAAPSVPREPRIRFLSPSELRNYDPSDDIVLVGDCHIMRGEVFVIGGEPGVGKSTAATELAICGATGRPWLGLPVHARFRTMIVQTENGRYRLRQEYAARANEPELEEMIRVSEPPPFGLTLANPEFRDDIQAALQAFRPEVVILDPWNAAARDDKQRDYSDAFTALRALLPTGPDKPALGIVAHTRKPKPDEKRTGGSGLMHLLSGSHVLASVPRSIFVMVRGSLDETDDSVIWFNPKNSNGPSAPRSAWERGPSGFRRCEDFAWEEFDGGQGRKVVTMEDLRTTLGDRDWLPGEAAKKLAAATSFGLRACQKALQSDGRFGTELRFTDGRIRLAGEG